MRALLSGPPARCCERCAGEHGGSSKRAQASGIGTIEGPIVGTLLFFALQEWLADLGTTYLIILGVLAIVVTIRMPNGLWGWFSDRTGVSLFPVGRRLEMREE